MSRTTSSHVGVLQEAQPTLIWSDQPSAVIRLRISLFWSDRPLRGAKQPVGAGWRRSAAGHKQPVKNSLHSGHSNKNLQARAYIWPAARNYPWVTSGRESTGLRTPPPPTF